MENNSTPSKLDETLKENLSNYDAKYDSGDWARMERMLDAAPKSIAPKGSYNMAIIIGGIVLVGGFAIYKGVTSSSDSKPESTTETEITTPEVKTETAAKPAPVNVVKPSPSVVSTNTTTPVVSTVVPEVKTTSPAVKNTSTTTETKPPVLAEKKKNEKKTSSETDPNKITKMSVMGNEPIFGDMIDSSKGIIHKTKEKESTKKAAVEKGSKSTVGLSSLFNLNADSLRKQKELMQKDTTQH